MPISQKIMETSKIKWVDVTPKIGFLAALLGIVLIKTQAALAVTYKYIGKPLTSASGSTLSGHPIIFDYSTYNLLPADLTFDRDGEVPPASNVPAINWSLSVGQYQATGIGGSSLSAV